MTAALSERLKPAFAWPTVMLAVACLSVFAASTSLAVTGALWWSVAVVINTVAAYAAYTVVHEATHYNISARARHLRWVDHILGNLCGVLLMLPYYHHRREHWRHHAVTNSPDDPDIVVKGAFTSLVLVKFPVASATYLVPVYVFTNLRKLGLDATERLMTYAFGVLHASAFVLGYFTGHLMDVVLLWYLPAMLAGLVLAIGFQWLPHYPHDATDRYRATRISLWPGAEIVSLWQNLHLVHHLMPQIPFYRYADAFHELLPELEEHDARIEGLRPYAAPTASALRRYRGATQPA